MNTGEEHIILVNEHDEQTGTGEKMAVHENGMLHRALSIFVTDGKNNVLLQRRAEVKYHSGGLWTNTCCSHPRQDEIVIDAAHRRLMEEMGFDCELKPIFTLRYKADVGNRLIENEYDHIYAGEYTGEISPNDDEVMDYKYASIESIEQDLNKHPEKYTAWFKIAWPIYCKYLQNSSDEIKHYSRS